MELFNDVIAAASDAVAMAPVAIEYEQQQQTRDWFKSRLGKFSASKVDDLMTGGRGSDWGKTALAVVQKVYIERTLSEEGVELYIDEMMYKEFRSCEWGNKYEPFARAELAKIIGDIELVGSIVHPDMPFFSGSADGRCNGVPVELKCPYNILVHDANLEMDVIDEKNTYYGQIQSHMMIAGTSTCVFASFDPRRVAPANFKYWVVDRDEVYIAKLTDRLIAAEEMVQVKIKNN